MKQIVPSKKFRRDIKRGLHIATLEQILKQIRGGTQLPQSKRVHKLQGIYEGCWECHVEPDWLLIWEDYPEYILPIRTGTHSDLFK